jgi:Dyp-type peroxidase family
MMSIDFSSPIDHQSRYVRELLARLQGNILRGFERDEALHVFLVFDPRRAAEAKAWIRSRIAGLVTSCRQHLEEEGRHGANGSPRSLLANFFLSATGYRALGVPEERLPRDCRFRDGMKFSLPLLNDPPVEDWDEPFRGEVHAMVLLMHDDPGELDRLAGEIVADVAGFGRILGVERGHRLVNRNGDGIEHFGFVDGRSQPLFLIEDLERERTLLDGASIWDPSAGLDLVLDLDPCADDPFSFGSYLVYRKLEQNVRGFREMELEMARELGLPDPERAGALVVGRFRDGTPLSMAYAPGMCSPVPNNFDFASDPAGLKCPFQSHIRKANPRGDEIRNSPQKGRDHLISRQERSHRIVRRGLPYGERLKHPCEEQTLEEMPTSGVGMLFLCFQRDISEQFEHIQSIWMNAKDSLRRTPLTGRDPLAGQDFEALRPGEPIAPSGQVWPTRWAAPLAEHRAFNFGGHVTMRGGEYFFSPSLMSLAHFS